MRKCPNGTYPYTIQAGDTLWKLAQHFNTTVQEIASLNPMMNEYNLSIGQVICIPQYYEYYEETPSSSEYVRITEQLLHDHLRLLWEQHVYWTRMVILSILMELPDEEAATKRLLRNPRDFAAVFRLYYGKDTAEQFEELLTSHLVIASEFIKATKAGDNTAAADTEKRWYANADEIADFLGSINPYWSAQEWKKLLYDHLAMIKEEVRSLLQKNYEGSINIFENIEKEALIMADTMTQGLIKQFPQSFG